MKQTSILLIGLIFLITCQPLSAKGNPCQCIYIEQSVLGHTISCEEWVDYVSNQFALRIIVQLDANYYFKGNSSFDVKFIDFETTLPVTPLSYNDIETSSPNVYYKGDKIQIQINSVFPDRILRPAKTGGVIRLFIDTSSILVTAVKTPPMNNQVDLMISQQLN